MPIQEYIQFNSTMRVSRGSQDSQVQWGQISSTALRSICVENRVKITRYWKEEGFGYLYQALLMCETMVHLHPGQYG